MSPLAIAMRERFEDVCSRELVRLRRKTGALSPSDRAEVEALSAQVIRGCSSTLETILAGDLDEGIEEAVRRIFALSPREDRAPDTITTS
jgi:hypothetical protein